MGAAVQPQVSTIMAEITLANGVAAEGAEELFLPGEAMDGEMPEQPGFLPGSEGKHYSFVPQDKTPLSEKFSEFFSEVQKPKEQRTFDSKGEAHTLSYKESDPIKTKEFQVQKGEKPTIDGKKEETQRPTHTKADQAARKSLETPKQHPPATRPMARMMQGKTDVQTTKTPVEQQTKQNGKEVKPEKKSLEKGEVRQQQKTQAREQQPRQHVDSQMTREQEKTDDRQEEQRRRDNEEEGFAEDERQQKQDDDPNGDESFKVSAVEKKGLDPEEVLTYAAEESTLLSELFNLRVNHFDVLTLFIEVLKLSLKGREQDRISRMRERELQLEHIQNMVDNFKQQGKWMLFSNLGSGVLAIVSGVSPILGHMKGDWILDKLSGVFSSLQDMEKDKFFKGVTKMTFAMSEMYKSTGQIQNTFAESSRTYDQHMAEIRKTDWEEDTRSMEELKDQWKNIENFLHQSLQTYHDAVRQLYS